MGVDELNRVLKEEIVALLKENTVNDAASFELPENGVPYVIMVVGVNGVGKTTTIGKLAYKFKEAGKKVVLGAADTFRAAAVDQLVIWADRVGVPIVKQAMGADRSTKEKSALPTYFLRTPRSPNPSQKFTSNSYLLSLRSKSRYVNNK